MIPLCLILDGYGVDAWAVVEMLVGSGGCSSLTLLCLGVDQGVLEVAGASAVMKVVVAADAVRRWVGNVYCGRMNVHRTGSADAMCNFVIQGRKRERGSRLVKLWRCQIVAPSCVDCPERVQVERRRVVRET